jgi:hypothetical protein
LVRPPFCNYTLSIYRILITEMLRRKTAWSSSANAISRIPSKLKSGRRNLQESLSYVTGTSCSHTTLKENIACLAQGYLVSDTLHASNFQIFIIHTRHLLYKYIWPWDSPYTESGLYFMPRLTRCACLFLRISVDEVKMLFLSLGNWNLPLSAKHCTLSRSLRRRPCHCTITESSYQSSSLWAQVSGFFFSLYESIA